MEQQRKAGEPGEPKAPKQTMPPRRIWVAFLAALAANFLVMRLFFPGADTITVPYTAFKEQVAKHNVESIYSQGESIEGRFKEPVTWPPEKADDAKGEPKKAEPERAAFPAQPASRTESNFTTTLPAFVDPGLEDFLIEHGV